MNTKIKSLLTIFLIGLIFILNISSNAAEIKSDNEIKESKYTVTCYGLKDRVIFQEKVLTYTYIDGKLQVTKENNNAPFFIYGKCHVQ